MNSTTDPRLKSFIPVPADSPFPIQNLPYGVFRPGGGVSPRVGVAIGEKIVDLAVLEHEEFFKQTILAEKKVFSRSSLNSFLQQGKTAWHEARVMISKVLRNNEPLLRNNDRLREAAILSQDEVELLLPVQTGDYTDFYSSREHAENVGSMFRDKNQPLLPNWLHLPVAYHGRASSIVLSGTDIHRPKGQYLSNENDKPVFSATQKLDFELEMGFFTGPGNSHGHQISVDTADDHIFGLVLVNDWSARDIQRWEYQPLGPFLSKNFATSISPWVVTLEALEPFRTKGPDQNPIPLPYLQCNHDCAYDINLEIWLQSKNAQTPVKISTTNFKYMYWNICQQLAHHTVNGCNIRPGDLMASGTISGPDPASCGSMLEITQNGEIPVILDNNEKRTFLQDGDTVILKGCARGDGYQIGFGELKTKILSAL